MAIHIQWWLVAVIFDVIGTALYVRHALKTDQQPNAATWAMLSFEFVIVGLLEWDQHASLSTLSTMISGVACTAVIMIVTWMQHRKDPSQFELDTIDKLSVGVNIVLTLLFAAAMIAEKFHVISSSLESSVSLGCLIILVTLGFASMIPLFRGILKNPLAEDPFSWTLWALMWTATILEAVSVNDPVVQYLYPASGVIICFACVLPVITEKSKKRT